MLKQVAFTRGRASSRQLRIVINQSRYVACDATAPCKSACHSAVRELLFPTDRAANRCTVFEVDNQSAISATSQQRRHCSLVASVV